jgi:hypothetical protein
MALIADASGITIDAKPATPRWADDRRSRPPRSAAAVPDATPTNEQRPAEINAWLARERSAREAGNPPYG